MESTVDIQVGDVVAPRAAVSIEITSTPVLSYALAHNQVPVVSRLALTNLGGPVRAATVRLGVRDAEGPIAQTVELLADGPDGERVVLGESSRAVQVLAAQQWLATPLPLALEMLAAHVMPNHPAITALVSEAADQLEQDGDGSIDGYAHGPERVDAI